MRFQFRMPSVEGAESYIAFTYPHNYAKLEDILLRLDQRYPQPRSLAPPLSPHGIYYFRETLCYSLDGRRVDMLTVTSNDGASDSCEDPFDIAAFFPSQYVCFHASMLSALLCLCFVNACKFMRQGRKIWPLGKKRSLCVRAIFLNGTCDMSTLYIYHH